MIPGTMLVACNKKEGFTGGIDVSYITFRAQLKYFHLGVYWRVSVCLTQLNPFIMPN